LDRTSRTEQTRQEGGRYNLAMHRLPNQISSERADLLVQIERCRRLAKSLTDHTTVERLLALAVEYEMLLDQDQPVSTRFAPDPA